MKMLALMTLSMVILSCGSSSGPGMQADLPDAADTVNPSDPGGDGKCTPACSGKLCGPDGCGGVCGGCKAYETCNPLGICVPSTKCGDVTKVGCCDGSTLWLCKDGELVSKDCAADPKCGWDAVTGGYSCGTDGSESLVFPLACPFACVPECEGKKCGPDGCGGNCGHCGAGETCGADGKCMKLPDCASVTKIGCCDGVLLWTCEDGKVSAIDCSSKPKCGWNPVEGGYACGTDGSEGPGGAFPKDCAWACKPACGGKQCGPDGCGGDCGTCPDGGLCNPQGLCCMASCDGKDCGDDGCGGSCGKCPEKQQCVAGKCQGGCQAACDGKDCGPDGCGGLCGECGGGLICTTLGKCVVTCVPDCAGKQCGDDGCGKNCPPGCPQGKFCEAGKCTDTCTPKCTGKLCGPDGCGKECGKCPAGKSCTIDGQCGSACAACPSSPSCLNMGFESGNLAGWSAGGDAVVIKTLGATAAPEGQYMLRLSNKEETTGEAAYQVCVPANATGLRFTWRLYSEEFKEWCGSQFQDYFEVGVAGAGGSKVVFARNIDDLCEKGSCAACAKQYVGLSQSDVQLDQGDTWRTPWQVAHVDIAPIVAGKEQVLTISFDVGDKGDNIFETLVLIDDVAIVSGCSWACEGKQCGPDGCGGQCGLCPSGNCTNGQCGACQPQCAGKNCGPDGCNGTCGTCKTGQACQAGTCITTSDPCNGKCTPEKPICHEVTGGQPICVQCNADSDCAKFPGCKCQKPAHACTDSQGKTCTEVGQQTCQAKCESDGDCPASLGFQFGCASGVCYDKGGHCDGVTACCAPGQTCVDIGMTTGLGGFLPGQSLVYCTCNTDGDCLADLSCKETSVICAIPMIGSFICPGGVPPEGLPAKLCGDLSKILPIPM